MFPTLDKFLASLFAVEEQYDLLDANYFRWESAAILLLRPALPKRRKHFIPAPIVEVFSSNSKYI